LIQPDAELPVPHQLGAYVHEYSVNQQEPSTTLEI
jgi:hypothetical protein